MTDSGKLRYVPGMPRPRGFRLNASALHDVLLLKRWNLTEAAERSGMSLTTLSGLAKHDHNASIKTCEKLAQGLGCSAETLFPELAGFADAREAVA